MSKDLLEKGYNDYYSVDDLPLTEDQKEMVLEWYAQKIWGGLSERGHCKSYDPLIIEGKVAHSYIFDLNGLDHRTDGGRHHNFKTLPQLEERLENEMKLYADNYTHNLKVKQQK